MTPEAILTAVCDAAGISLGSLTGPGKSRFVSRPRHLACLLLIQHGGISDKAASAIIHRHPNIVRYGAASALRLLETDQAFKDLHAAVLERLETRRAA